MRTGALESGQLGINFDSIKTVYVQDVVCGLYDELVLGSTETSPTCGTWPPSLWAGHSRGQQNCHTHIAAHESCPVFSIYISRHMIDTSSLLFRIWICVHCAGARAAAIIIIITMHVV